MAYNVSKYKTTTNKQTKYKLARSLRFSDIVMTGDLYAGSMQVSMLLAEGLVGHQTLQTSRPCCISARAANLLVVSTCTAQTNIHQGKLLWPAKRRRREIQLTLLLEL